MDFIKGGVTAAKGFKAAGIHCGIRRNQSKKDLSLVFAEKDCTAAAVYTKNVFKAAPILVTMENLSDGRARAMITNSGNANACTPDGVEKAKKMCSVTARALGIDPSDVIVASTGVIGQSLNVDVIEAALPALVSSLSCDGTPAAEAILTTDTVKKEAAVRFELDGKPVTIGGMAKGSGMINPNMGTMLAFITTDAAISSAMLKEALLESVGSTYNRVCVDGDTSTNDMCAVLASGLAGNDEITEKNGAYAAFAAALTAVNEILAKAIAKDGEGATKLITCVVRGAKDAEAADTLSMAVVSSSLVKAAMFGADANCGRVLCAMGYSGAPFDKNKVDVYFESQAGRVQVCGGGCGLSFDEELAKKVLTAPEITIDISLDDGGAESVAWGCDLTYDYVRINGDYRT